MPNQKILLIEHDLAVIEATRSALAGAGYQVEVARDGEAGVQAFRRLQPDLVVIDPLVAKKQGFEVCKEIKQSSGGSDTPVLIATDSYKDSENRQSALSFYGCDEFLERPLSDEALLALCRRFLVQAAPVRPTPPAAPAPQARPASSSGTLALDDLDEGEIMARLDSLIDASFVTGDEPQPAETPPPAAAAEPPVATPRPAVVEPVVAAPAPPVEIEPLPVEVERVTVAPAAAPVSRAVASVPPAETPPTPVVEAVDTPVPLPSIAPDSSLAAAPAAVDRSRRVAPPAPVLDIDLPSQDAPASPSASPLPGASVIPSALPAEGIPQVRRTRRGKTPSFLLLGGALAVGLVVAALAFVPRWFGGEPATMATSPASRPVPSPASNAPVETVAPPSGVSPDTTRPQGATATESAPPPATVAQVQRPASPPAGTASSPARETPDGFVASRPAQTTRPTQQQGHTARPLPAAAPLGVESAPMTPATAFESTPGPTPHALSDPALEEPYASPEPVRERFVPASESVAIADIESLMPTPEAPKPLPDTLFELAKVDVPPISLQRDTPTYPAAARRMRQEGVVELEVLIDFRGRVVDARVTGGKAGSLLNRAALEGVRGWSYQPAHEAGVPVRVWKPERVVFRY